MQLQTLVHAARLIVKPTPSTLSESFAILRHVKKWGEVVRFQEDKPSISRLLSSQRNGDRPFQDATSTVYAVEFASLPRPFVAPNDPPTAEKRQEPKLSLRFKVDANAFHPRPQDLDPFNVRGLLTRKPSPEPRKFSCKLMMVEEQSEADTSAKTDETQIGLSPEHDPDQNSYSGPFIVDTSSIFAQILRDTGTPPHLIAGLLPKLDDPSGEATTTLSSATAKADAVTAATLSYTSKRGRKVQPSRRATRKWLYAKNKRLRAQPRGIRKEHFSLMELYEKVVKRDAQT